MTPRDHQSQEAVYLKIITDVIDDELDDEYVNTNSETALRVVINTEDNMYFQFFTRKEIIYTRLEGLIAFCKHLCNFC